MKKSRYTEHQIVNILKQADAGLMVKEICRKYGISDATYYNWKSRYGGMSASELKRLKETEAELPQYKKMYAELAHENCTLKDLIGKSSGATGDARGARCAPVRITRPGARDHLPVDARIQRGKTPRQPGTNTARRVPAAGRKRRKLQFRNVSLTGKLTIRGGRLGNCQSLAGVMGVPELPRSTGQNLW